MSIQESIKITPKGEVVFLEWDHIGEKVNKLSTPIMMHWPHGGLQSGVLPRLIGQSAGQGSPDQVKKRVDFMQGSVKIEPKQCARVKSCRAWQCLDRCRAHPGTHWGGLLLES